MEILKTQIKIKVFGQDIELKPPTARKAAEFSKSIKGVDDDCLMIDLTTQFLNSCGLPQDICEELELDHMQKLVELITTKKK